jgi:hypothetical protein
MVFGYFRQVLYISLLSTNAIAILNEDRFLAKSEPAGRHSYRTCSLTSFTVGWSTRSQQSANAGFGHAPNAYDTAFGGTEVSVKAKLVNLIGATRTLMRCRCLSMVDPDDSTVDCIQRGNVGLSSMRCAQS